jgi:hypothetical protein
MTDSNEPQAGAQVPSRDALSLEDALQGLIHDVQEWCEAVEGDSSWDGWDDHYKALYWNGGLDTYRAALDRSKSHLNTIRDYVKEAQVVLITREDMHDPLKAQAFWDEAQGAYRIILSETGDGSKG